MRKKNASMIATAIAFALALPAGALAQDNSGNGPAVVSPLQLPGTAGAPQAQVPQPQSDAGVNWKGVGVGAGTAVGNVLYVPAKLAYGILGSVAGGVGWAVTGGNTQVANTIWRSSLGGDYVLTPNMVAGQEPDSFHRSHHYRTDHHAARPGLLVVQRQHRDGDEFEHDGAGDAAVAQLDRRRAVIEL